MYDLIIKNAAVLDGTGAPHYYSDVAVKDGKIACVAKKICKNATKIIDARGLYLSPGFIDAHSHYDSFMEMDHSGWNELIQGITTSVAGQCGQSPFPAGAGFEADLNRILDTIGGVVDGDFLEKRGTFEAFLKSCDYPLGHHVAFHVGHASLRASVMGYASRKPTKEEMELMKERLREAMKNGALGITFGLIYPPSSYADLEEMTELCAVSAEFGGDFTVHLRDEAEGLYQSVSDMIEISRKTGARLICSHHKSIFKQNWGNLKKTTALIEQSAKEGVDVFYDVYPYTASSTTLGRFIPQEMFALGLDEMLRQITEPESRKKVREQILKGRDPAEFFSDTMVGSSQTHPEYAGRFLPDIAKEQGKDTCELYFDTIIADRNTASGIYHRMCEEDVETAIRNPRGMLGTDGLYSPVAKGLHPRAFGSFTRYLGHYVRERGVVTLPEAIRKITSMPAAVYSLPNKGLILEGMDADMVLFDPETIIDKATYLEPTLVGEGIKYVFIMGEIAAADGKITDVRRGKPVLRKGC